MTASIREYVIARLVEYLPQLPIIGGTAFRKTVMSGAIEKYNISVASAATHYNHALKAQRAADPVSVDGLGRTEIKKNDQPIIHLVDVIQVNTGKVILSNVSVDTAEQIIALAVEKKKTKLEIRATENASVQ